MLSPADSKGEITLPPRFIAIIDWGGVLSTFGTLLEVVSKWILHTFCAAARCEDNAIVNAYPLHH